MSEAARSGGSVSICGGRHAMGGQQFAEASTPLDMRSMDKVARFDREATREQVEAAYPRFVDFLREKDRRDPGGVFASTWHRHHRSLFEDRL